MKVLVVVWIIWILLWSSTGCSVFLGLRILAPSFGCWIGWVGSYRVRRSLVALNLEGEWRKGFWWIASEESGFVSFPVSFCHSSRYSCWCSDFIGFTNWKYTLREGRRGDSEMGEGQEIKIYWHYPTILIWQLTLASSINLIQTSISSLVLACTG